MKLKDYFFPRLSIILAFGLSLIGQFAHAGKDYLGANYETYSGFSVPEEAVFPAKETHPSLWFDQSQLERFSKKIYGNKKLQAYWTKVKNHRYLNMDLPPVVKRSDGKVAIHKYYGDMTQIALYNGFMVWMATSDQTKGFYLQRAVDALLRTYDGPIYQLDPRKSGVDKSVDEIYRGVWNQSLIAAYDFVQPLLTKEQDQKIRDLLIREAVYTYENLHTWAAGPHNHLSKPAWGLASLAIGLSDHPDSKAWYKEAIKAANQNTRYHFSADGIYREGAQYYLFSWLNFVPYLYHYKHAANQDLFDIYQPVFEWAIKARNGKGWLMNLEDSFIRPIPTQMVSSAYLNAKTTLNANASLGNVLQWNYYKTDFSPFDLAEKNTGFNYTGASWDYPKELYELLTYNPTVKTAEPTVDPTVFLEGGQTFFRNHWQDEQNQQQFLMFHGVPHADNHDHHDQLSFVISANGQILASDQGYTRKSYGEKMRYEWYRTAQAHNTLTFNNVPLGDFIENRPAPSEFKLNSSIVDFEQKSAPFRDYLKPEIAEASRGIAYIQDEYFIVFDEVKSNTAGEIALYFHPGRASHNSKVGNSELDNLNVDSSKPSSADSQLDVFDWHYQENEYGPATGMTFGLFSKANSPTEAQALRASNGLTLESNQPKVKIKKGESTYIKGDYQSFDYVESTLTSNQAQFVQVILPYQSESGSSAKLLKGMESLPLENGLAGKIETLNGTDYFILGQSKLQIQKINLDRQLVETDSKLLWYRLDQGKIGKVFLKQGTQFSFNEKSLLALDYPATVALNYSKEKIEATFELAPNSIGEKKLSKEGIKIRVSLSNSSKAKQVLVNNQSIPFSQTGDQLVLKVHGTGTVTVKL